MPHAVTAYRAHYTAGALLDVTVHPGIPELLAALTGGGALLAVATSKPEPFAVRVLAHTGLLPAFASVHGATLDGAVRHKDQVVAAALAAHPDGRDPVLVGDRNRDDSQTGVFYFANLGALANGTSIIAVHKTIDGGMTWAQAANASPGRSCSS